MPDLADGESTEMKGSAAKPYELKNTGGVYSCSCPAWRNQSIAIEKRTCKHLRKLRGDDAEKERTGGALPTRAKKSGAKKDAPPLLLAQTWDNAIELKDWWISEKLDGVRAYWDGKRFLSRLGNQYHAPEWFTQGLPETPLDGELWIDRKAFQRTVSVVRRQDKSEHWKEVKFVLFDAPGQTEEFEERIEFLKDLTKSIKNKNVDLLKQMRCKGTAHLQQELEKIESLGGEGLMLREPNSRYQVGRSSTLLKVKTFHDAEATVLDYVKGKGKHKGRMGAVVVELEDGTQFSVGTGFSDKQRENPPAIGDEITFRYQELSNAGVPRFPSFVRAGASSKGVTPKKKATKKKATKVPAKKATQTSAAGSTRYFELVDEKSAKFWEISKDGETVTVRYGRIGTDGTSKPKDFPSEEKADAHCEKLIEKKTDKGYVEK